MEAKKLTHDLTLHYGLLSYDYKNETEYLEKAKSLTSELLKADEIDLDDLFFGNPPNRQDLQNTLHRILLTIEKIKKIPMEKRHFDFL